MPRITPRRIDEAQAPPWGSCISDSSAGSTGRDTSTLRRPERLDRVLGILDRVELQLLAAPARPSQVVADGGDPLDDPPAHRDRVVAVPVRFDLIGRSRAGLADVSDLHCPIVA